MAISLGSMNSPSMQQTPPGYPEFVMLDPKFKCLKCRKVLRDAVQTMCGHRMCEVCAFDMFKEPPPIRCPGDEDSCVPVLKKEEIFRDPSARREIGSLPVYCTNKVQGCKKEMQWKELEGHELSCDYTPVQCSYITNGCPVSTIRKSLEDHLQTCHYRFVRCTYCSDQIIFNQRQAHESVQCRKFPIPCPNQCGIHDLPRDEMLEHAPDCPKKPSHCKFRNVGCDFVGSDTDVGKHEKGSIDSHLQLTTVYTASIDLQNMTIRREIQVHQLISSAFARIFRICIRVNVPDSER